MRVDALVLLSTARYSPACCHPAACARIAVSHRRELCALADAILAIAVVIKASSATTATRHNLYTRAAEIGTRTLRLDIFQFTQQNLLTLFQIT